MRPGDIGVLVADDRVSMWDRAEFGSGRLEYQPRAVRSAYLSGSNWISIGIPALSTESSS